MRILILGAGGIGGYFGGRLGEAGADVTFLVRAGRAAQLARDGLVVKSPAGDLAHPVRFVGADALADDGRFDAVLLTCKAYDLEAAIATIAPAMANGASVVPMLNGMRHLDRLDLAFGRERVLGGMCQIAATLTPTGEVHHLNNFHLLALGARMPGQETLARRFAEAAAGAKFTCNVSEDIVQDMWEKFVMLATMAAMTCLMRANVGEIVQADDGAALTRETLAECDLVARAAGHPSRPAFLARAEGLLTERGSNFAASMLRDVERGGMTEAEHIVGDMLARARAAGLPAPMLRVAWCHLQAHEARRLAGRL
ncbi:MAG TPA: 2-dehydropantoate 2-reductase [Acetobacteraceae bacterium]|nr:2-dehydropantoate 2-reductase [Acetobacteraceae bacterium]